MMCIFGWQSCNISDNLHIITLVTKKIPVVQYVLLGSAGVLHHLTGKSCLISLLGCNLAVTMTDNFHLWGFACIHHAVSVFAEFQHRQNYA